jgi:reactive chlorine resistance protein C
LDKTASNTVQSAGQIITAVGTAIVRYGVAIVIAWIGLLKFTGSEAMRIQQYISHSPFMSWLNGVLSMQALSDVIGTIEIAAAVLIALHVVSPRLGVVGGALGTLLFLSTLSFLFTTPGIGDTAAGGFPALSPVGQFLIKDIVLLGATILALGESLTAMRSPVRRGSGVGSRQGMQDD